MIAIKGEMTHNQVSGKKYALVCSDQLLRVMVFREAPRLVFTGLTKTLGAPRDLEKNLEDARYFETAVDITTPHAETNELKSETVAALSALTVATPVTVTKVEERKEPNPEIKQRIS